MAASNRERVGHGLALLTRGLGPFVQRMCEQKYGRRTAEIVAGALPRLSDARVDGDDWKNFDGHALLVVMRQLWNEVFYEQLGQFERGLVNELLKARNDWAHEKPFSTEDAHRALDSIQRLLTAISAKEAAEAEEMAVGLLRVRYEESTRRQTKQVVSQPTSSRAAGSLKPWREVVHPHPDVATRGAPLARFAADLSAVHQGRADSEYGDPTEFFRRTYLTGGLQRLLKVAAERLGGQGGAPVVRLQTTFGGGKTHAMLALYHLFGGGVRLPDVPEVAQILGVDHASDVPRATRGVFVGTRFNPASPTVHADGVSVRTMWGELAYQLGGAEGLAMVADADREAAPPGADTLAELFRRYAPVLILIDEWVAFTRALAAHPGRLSAGTFDGNLTFAQSLSEAAASVDGVLVVASLPNSDAEVGGRAGQETLDQLSRVFQRVDAPWAPAEALESFEIVRRRLFGEVTDYAARDAVVAAFMSLYREHHGDFPPYARQVDYERQLKSAYPIHPELFRHLYETWSTLERFQRTRGVLRLMAEVIHALWDGSDRSLLVMPGSLPLEVPEVKTALSDYLDDSWQAVISKDVDGPDSRPSELDSQNTMFGSLYACRRVTRTIFLGTAPSGTGQSVRGMETDQVKLGTVQPGEAIGVMGDALNELRQVLTYLYHEGSRLWFDTHPSIRREAEDRAVRQPSGAVSREVLRRLRGASGKSGLRGGHVAETPGDVPDLPDGVRLAILPPDHPYAREDNNAAQRFAETVLADRGHGPRQYKNVLVFLALDEKALGDVDLKARRFLAWTELHAQKDVLNLDVQQTREVEHQRARADEDLQRAVTEGYRWLLVPDGEVSPPWVASRLGGHEDNLTKAVFDKLRGERIVDQWGWVLLRAELDRWFWKENAHLSLTELWTSYAKYTYLTRLTGQDVLVKAVRDGAEHKAWALADRLDDTGQYVGLVWGEEAAARAPTLVVKRDVAEAQFAEMERRRQQRGGEAASASDAGGPAVAIPGRGADVAGPETAFKAPATRPRYFGSVPLTYTGAAGELEQIIKEVIRYLASSPDAEVSLTLEVSARLPANYSEDERRAVLENARHRKFTVSGFTEE